MSRILAPALAALLALANGANAQSISAQRLSGNIRAISTDDFQGRYPGAEGERMTLDWLQSQYEAIGLKPGGPDGGWLQPIDLKRYTPTGPGSASWTGPDGQTHELKTGGDILLRAMTNDGRASIRDAEVVFVGYGIHAPERHWDDYGDVDLRGKVVLVVSGEPSDARFDGEAMTYYATADYKADEVVRRGAVGMVVLFPLKADDAGWRRTADYNAMQRMAAPGAADTEFSAALNMDASLRWLAVGGLDAGVLDRLGDGSFRARSLNLTLSAEVEETFDTFRTHNLLAKIEGSERPDETIIYSAHWDHAGGPDQNPRTRGDDKTFNGAWDNASGTAGLIEIAREMTQAPQPRRTVIFAHLGAEEMGLMGAYAYAADPVYPLETTVANINIDMLPLSGPTRDFVIAGKGRNELEDRLQALAEPLGRYVSADHTPEEGFYYRSDHFPFARAGVPSIMPWHGWDLVEGGREAGEAAWRTKFGADYHRPSDEWAADLDLRSAVENLTLLYRLGMDLANSGDWPGWKPTAEFAQVRARSDAARR